MSSTRIIKKTPYRVFHLVPAELLSKKVSEVTEKDLDSIKHFLSIKDIADYLGIPAEQVSQAKFHGYKIQKRFKVFSGQLFAQGIFRKTQLNIYYEKQAKVQSNMLSKANKTDL